MICLTLSADTLRGMAAQAARYTGYYDLLELRLDLLRADERESLSAMESLPAWATELPLVLTFRRSVDGGAYPGAAGGAADGGAADGGAADGAGPAGADAEAARLSFLRHMVENGLRRVVEQGGSAYLDLEDDVAATVEGARAAEAAHRYGVRVIRSRHDFSGTPADPAAALAELAACGGPGEIPKLAVHVRGSRDLVRLVQAAKATEPGTAVIVGMGAFGFPTRVLAPRLGSVLSYCCDCEGQGGAVAPGQIDPKTMAELYRYRSITVSTKVYGITGNPVLHSRSPAYHNGVFGRDGRNAVYLPFPTDDLDAFQELMQILGIRGLSVTIPHKEAVARWFLGSDGAAEVQALGACNTVTRSVSGRLCAANTDVEGFLGPLRERMPSLAGRGATVIGAGGAARAVVYGLLSAGAHVLILNRNLDRAAAVVREFAGLGSVAAAALHADSLALVAQHCEIVVQTTSVGMHPDIEADPFPFYEFTGTELLYEIIYTPARTRLLERAAAAGCTVIGGEEMFHAQAALQAKMFAQASGAGRCPTDAP